MERKEKMGEKKGTKNTLLEEIHSAVLERANKRLFILLMIAIIAIFASNACWLYAWCQYDYESYETITVDGEDGSANYLENNSGEVNY